jgi:hypothetical protein
MTHCDRTNHRFKPKMKVRNRVVNLNYGLGTITGEWGTWNSCRVCFDVMKGLVCPACGWIGHGLQVAGTGIYDVKFDSETITRSINECRLRGTK